MNITEKNLGSYLAAGSIAKPHLYLYMSGIFAFAAALWIYSICQSKLVLNKENKIAFFSFSNDFFVTYFTLKEFFVR